MSIRVHIAKAGKDAYIDISDEELAAIPEDTYKAIIAEGFKATLNAKMTKVGPVTKLEKEGRLEELAKENAAALTIANKNLAALKDGTYKFPGKTAKSAVPREVLAEAMRLARNVIRDQLRASNLPMNTLTAKELTEGAKALIDSRPDLELLDQAKANLSKRDEVPTDLIDLSKLGVDLDAAKAKAATAAKAKSENAKGLSAAKAGKTAKVAGRTKPKADAETIIAATAADKAHGHAVH